MELQTLEPFDLYNENSHSLSFLYETSCIHTDYFHFRATYNHSKDDQCRPIYIALSTHMAEISCYITSLTPRRLVHFVVAQHHPDDPTHPGQHCAWAESGLRLRPAMQVPSLGPDPRRQTARVLRASQTLGRQCTQGIGPRRRRTLQQ